MRILISTGEVSGDVAGALVVAELRRRFPEATLFGIGGQRLAAAGVEIVRETNHLGSVGFTETFGAIPALAGAFRSLAREVGRRRPQAALLIGNDLFNCLLSRCLRRRGVRTVVYFPPQVWLWRSQARPIARSYDEILTSFPEEQEVYREAGGTARFVGHYLCDLLATASDGERLAARARLGLGEDGLGRRVVAILPGSRTLELATLGPVLFEAAARLAERDPELRFVAPAADPRYVAPIAALVERFAVPRVTVLDGDGRAALAASDVALMASGTASLEAALLGTPMVLTYRLSAVTDAVVSFLRRIGWIRAGMVGLPNLLLGAKVVPELRQERATAGELAAAVGELLDRPELRVRMRADLGRIAPLLARGGTVGLVAEAVARAAEAARPEPLPVVAEGAAA